MWTEGIIDGLYYSIKFYSAPSELGIKGGKVSKLMLWRTGAHGSREIVARYERGWCLKPDDAETTAALQKLIEKYN